MQIVPLSNSYARDGFLCGKADLDEWLRRYAGQSERKGTTRTFLGLDDESGSVIGYYTTKACELGLDDQAAEFGVGKRRYPIPAMLIARLAVDVRHQGLGIGGRLLADALQRLVSVSDSIGFEVVVVDAIDMDASTFYRRYGFQNFEDSPLRLFMPTKSLRATFDSRQN